jgi:hypothetical protein
MARVFHWKMGGCSKVRRSMHSRFLRPGCTTATSKSAARMSSDSGADICELNPYDTRIVILVARITSENTREFLSFATTLPEKKAAIIRIHPPRRQRIAPIQRQNPGPFAILWGMAGIRGRSGPPANQNAFRHGQKAACGLPISQSPAVRDGKRRQNGVAPGDYRRDDRGRWDQRENQPRLSNDNGKKSG